MKILLILLCSSITFAQEITGNQLLDNAIKYHDPNNNWMSFNDTLLVIMSTPKASDRESEIIINLTKDYFKVKAKKDSNITEYTVNKGHCSITFNEKTNLTEAELEANKLSCERANLYKNYYTYLYGLPMKLKDPGTIINPKVERRSFKSKTYFVLNVSYSKEVGSDIWNFYFDPKTFAMEIYQFYKTDENGAPKPESGEYILLSDLEIIQDIKMPKIREWYYNKDDGYLGKDTLKH